MLRALVELVYPPRCAACGADVLREPFCPPCEDALLPVPPGCPVCGEPGGSAPPPGPLARCGACLASPPAFEAVGAGGLLGGPLADAIHAFKYGDRPALARPLGAWLAARVSLPAGARLLAIPLARGRRIARGYDQAALLAREVARAGRARLAPPALLARVRETAPQVGKRREERRRNVAGAFAADPRAAGLDLVLVDDVVTTGATAEAAARALREVGARSVRVVALARAG